ncbi:MAG: D-glycerate dehydrogenase [Proteobacteria bacterium]|nr:D-glycerate dehydrogenase [Pseudomonadota bacterium]
MTPPRVLVTRRIPRAGLNPIGDACDVELLDGELPPSRETMLARIRGCSGLLSLLTDAVDAELIAAAGPGLRVISNYAVGFDNIDLAAATRARIPVGNTPGVLTEATADLAFSLLMGAARRIAEASRFAREGRWRTWSPTLLLGADVHGATLGVVGMGRIGRALARRAAGFSMRVVYCDPVPGDGGAVPGAARVEWPELLAQADFLSLHVPLTEATRHMIDAAALARMKPTAILINTSRGGVVDHAALAQALADGVIGGAALDVTEPEPLPAGHPLYALDNCLVVPHLGSATVSTRDRMAVMAAQNLLAGLRGERLPHCVNPEVYG